MFKFSYDWLQEFSDIPVDFDELQTALYQQGFEISSIEEINNDKIVEIEVKANRPDILYLTGVLREFYSRSNIPNTKEAMPSMKLDFSHDNSVIKTKIDVLSQDVNRYCAVEINDVNNKGETPEIIKTRLAKLGINSINPIVDISNYITVFMGQPIHIFDLDKISGDSIIIENAKSDFKFKTLGNTEPEFPAKTLTISDDKDVLCIAGIIGGKKAEVDNSTKRILIESAHFDQIVSRVASKKSGVSTLASYRFERGVDRAKSSDAAILCAELITEYCGGKVCQKAYDYVKEDITPKIIKVSAKRINLILGTQLSLDEITKLLKKAFFNIKAIDGEIITVEVPFFRLDVKEDVDMAEEVARMYGYHNIEAKLPELITPLIDNPIGNNADLLRSILTGYGFIECLTYGFIPQNSMKMLNINDDSRYFGNIVLQNPLSALYSLMRPTLVYSMIDTVVNNVKVGKNDIKIFEIGKSYFVDKGNDIGYLEKEIVGGVLLGTKYPKGFGNNQEIKYSIYDMLDLVRSIFYEYDINYSLNKSAVGFFEENMCADIIVDNKIIGCVGKISNKVLNGFENGKLVRDDMLYFEIEYASLVANKKTISYSSEFPSIIREYNLLCDKKLEFANYSKDIMNMSNLIVDLSVADVYQGKGVPSDKSSVLIRIEYNAKTHTLTSNDVEEAEKAILKVLNDKYGIVLK